MGTDSRLLEPARADHEHYDETKHRMPVSKLQAHDDAAEGAAGHPIFHARSRRSHKNAAVHPSVGWRREARPARAGATLTSAIPFRWRCGSGGQPALCRSAKGFVGRAPLRDWASDHRSPAERSCRWSCVGETPHREPTVVCQQPPVVRRAQSDESAAIHTSQSTWLSQPWQGSRLASARETSASLQMPTGWTGSPAIASAMALPVEGQSANESHPAIRAT